MELTFILKFISHFSVLFIALIAGILSFKRLSYGQKLIFGELCIILVIGTWTLIRANNGLYSISVSSFGEFLFLGIELLYVDYESKSLTKKNYFRFLGLFLWLLIPIQWVFSGSLNYRNDSQIPISLFLISSYFFCIIYRPTKFSDQLLRWALLFYALGTFIFNVFADYILWNIGDELGMKLIKANYRISDVELLLIAISFLLVCFTKEKLIKSNKIKGFG